MFVIKIMISW